MFTYTRLSGQTLSAYFKRTKSAQSLPPALTCDPIASAVPPFAPRERVVASTSVAVLKMLEVFSRRAAPRILQPTSFGRTDSCDGRGYSGAGAAGRLRPACAPRARGPLVRGAAKLQGRWHPPHRRRGVGRWPRAPCTNERAARGCWCLRRRGGPRARRWMRVLLSPLRVLLPYLDLSGEQQSFPAVSAVTRCCNTLPNTCPLLGRRRVSGACQTHVRRARPTSLV